jgi:hypothetical protein
MTLTSLKVLEHSFSPAELLPCIKKQFIWGLLNDSAGNDFVDW